MLTSIITDSREPKDIQQIDYGVPNIVTMLDAGDVLAGCADGNTLVIERKTTDDLLGSIRDGRLFSQCAKMREVSQFCYVVVVGRMQRAPNGNVEVIRHLVWVQTGWNWDSMWGALLTVQELGIGVILTDDFQNAVVRLSQRNRDNVIVQPTRLSEPVTPDEAFLCSLPGIGPTTAKKLLSKGPACWALDWLTNIWDTDIKIKGIGRNQKVKIRRVLGLGAKEYQTVNLKE